MITWFAKKHKTAEYKIGEIVYLFNSESKSRKGKKILGKIPDFEGYVIEKKGSEYKIQYETDESKFMIDWFSVTNITSKTRLEDNSRRKRGNYQSYSLRKILWKKLDRVFDLSGHIFERPGMPAIWTKKVIF